MIDISQFVRLFVSNALHHQQVIYRDIKPENLLVDEQGCLKLCDFGFARYRNGAGEPLTDYVATRWYRSPELLLGPPFEDGSGIVQYMYSSPIDMWAIGCLMVSKHDMLIFETAHAARNGYLTDFKRIYFYLASPSS